MKKVKPKIIHIFLPISILLMLAALLLPAQNMLLLQLTFLGAMLYVMLSLLHHYKDKSLTSHLTLEYILIATLVMVMMIGIIN